MALLVQFESVGSNLVVQMDRKIGDAQKRPLEVHEPHRCSFLVAKRDTSCERKIAIEPSVRQHAAIGLDAQLVIALGMNVGIGLDPQIRGIRVGADDPEAGIGWCTLSYFEGRERTARAHDVVSSAGPERPGFTLVERCKTSPLEALDRRCDGVIRSGRRIDKGQEVVDAV
jgi:hypothetical protein